LANPCQGVRGKSEKGRTVYIEDAVYTAVHDASDVPLRDAMDLAYLTGQRPADVLAMSEHDVKDGELWVKQSKTGKKLRIAVEGELKALLERFTARKSLYKVRALRLVVNESGKPLTKDALRSRFDKAREAAAKDHPELAESIKNFQFRDLRAKAGTDKAETSGDIRQAQKQLGHASVGMTEHYVRDRKGDQVGPTR
jgi:integrase